MHIKFIVAILQFELKLSEHLVLGLFHGGFKHKKREEPEGELQHQHPFVYTWHWAWTTQRILNVSLCWTFSNCVVESLQQDHLGYLLNMQTPDFTSNKSLVDEAWENAFLTSCQGDDYAHSSLSTTPLWNISVCNFIKYSFLGLINTMMMRVVRNRNMSIIQVQVALAVWESSKYIVCLSHFPSFTSTQNSLPLVRPFLPSRPDNQTSLTDWHHQ